MKPDITSLVGDVEDQLNTSRYWVGICKDFLHRIPSDENKKSLAEANDIYESIHECYTILNNIKNRYYEED